MNMISLIIATTSPFADAGLFYAIFVLAGATLVAGGLLVGGLRYLGVQSVVWRIIAPILGITILLLGSLAQVRVCGILSLLVVLASLPFFIISLVVKAHRKDAANKIMEHTNEISRDSI